MSGVDKMNYMTSTNANNGDLRLTVNFDVATDPNIDQILTQLRVSQAQSQLPQDVNNFGVTVQKSVSAPLMLVSLTSPKQTYDGIFLANYAYINLVDQLSRLPGISNVQVFGAGQYAMRLWVKPDQLAKLGFTVPDIISAIQAQNTVNPAGKIGSEPIPKGQKFTYTVRAQGRLQTPEEFGDIVVRANTDGSFVRVKDIARIELGAQTYDMKSRLNGQPAAVLGIYQLPGSNAVQAAEAVRKFMAEAKQQFPADMEYVVSLDQTLSVTEGMDEILKTLVRSARAGRSRCLHFSARLARDPHSVVRGPGIVDWHLCFVSAIRLFDQHAVALWSRPRYRPGCRRRHCCCRSGRTSHRKRNESARGNAAGDAGSDRAGDWRGVSSCRGLHPNGFSAGDYRSIVSAICADYCHLGDLVRIQRAYA